MEFDYVEMLGTFVFEQIESLCGRLKSPVWDISEKSSIGPDIEKLKSDLWNALFRVIQEERNLLNDAADNIGNTSPGDAGSFGVVVDTIDVRIKELRKVAAAKGIPIQE